MTGVIGDMLRKSRCLVLMFGLILLVLFVSGCNQRESVPETSLISGRVVLGDDQGMGLAGVTLLIVDEASSHVETDGDGYFETTVPNEVVLVPRKTGYRFVPEKRILGDDEKLEFVAYPWSEPDFAKWGTQFSFDSHLDLVAAIAFSADDQYIASGSNDRTIRIWRRSDGQLVRTLYGHTSAIKVLAFSPQGDSLASGARDGKIKLWDWQTGLEIKTLEGHANMLTDLVWSPDGTKLASSGWDRTVRIWERDTGAELVSFIHDNWVRTVAWSSDGRFVLSGGEDVSLRVWDVDSGDLSASFEMRDKIVSLSAAPKGSLVAMVLGSGTLKVLNLETGEELVLGQYQGEATTLSWSFDGRYLAAGTDRLIRVWDSEKEEWVRSIDTGDYIFALNWGRESHVLGSGGYQGVIDLWSADSGEKLRRIAGHTAAVKALAWSPQGDYLASGGEDRIVRIWDLKGRKEEMHLLPGHNGPMEDLAWSPDGTYLASGGHDYLVRVWNVTEGDYLGAFTERMKRPFLNERGFEFAVGMHSVSHEDIVLSLSWSPNGKKLASASWDKTVAIWDVATQTQVVGVKNPQGWVTAVAWSPRSDEVAFGGYDQAIHFYSGITGDKVKELTGHTDWVQSLSWSPDGKHLASSSYDRTVVIWDLETDQMVRTLVGDENLVTVLEWSPCGRFLAGGSRSGTVRIWDVETGEILHTYPGRMLGLQSLAWSPKSDQLAITEYNSVIILGELDD